MSSRKVFVGNVPFSCTQRIFDKVFENIEGYLEGDIIINPKTLSCKGFGFVTLDTPENAEKLKKREDVKIGNRNLRFMDYSPSERQRRTNSSASYTRCKYIFVDGIPNGKNRKYLKETFSEYELESYYVSTDYETGEPKNHGRIEVKDYDSYHKLLQDCTIKDKEGNDIKLTKWKKRTCHNRGYGYKRINGSGSDSDSDSANTNTNEDRNNSE